MLWWIFLAAGWLVAAAWAVSMAQIVRFLRGNRLADRAGAMPNPDVWQKVTVVVPACDEAERIEEALRSLARLDYPALQVIAVNDRSRDETGAIINRIAAEEPRVRALHIAELPYGWLGKCHAMQAGANRAGGGNCSFSPTGTWCLPRRPCVLPCGFW